MYLLPRLLQAFLVADLSLSFSRSPWQVSSVGRGGTGSIQSPSRDPNSPANAKGAEHDAITEDVASQDAAVVRFPLIILYLANPVSHLISTQAAVAASPPPPTAVDTTLSAGR
jgi:hypothetical protein